MSNIAAFLGNISISEAQQEMDVPVQQGASRAFVSLLVEDTFFPGIQVLFKSIRKFSTFPFVVMMGSRVSESVRMRVAMFANQIILVDDIICPYQSDAKASWQAAEFTKLNVWNLVQFDKVIYIDADAMLVDTVDELFDIPFDFAAAPDIFPPDKFNAGVLVLKPSEHTFRNMMQSLGELPSYDGGDTGFLNAFFQDWYRAPSECRLSFGYNAQRLLYSLTHDKRPGYWESIKPLKIIHYSSTPKPWETSGPKGDLEFLWWSTFMDLS